MTTATQSTTTTTPINPPEQGTMWAIAQDAYGDADVLELRLVARPTPAGDEVLVRVRAAGVDRGVWHLMAGLPYVVRLAGFGVRRPKQPVLGSDLSGVVEAVGPDVTRFRPGDEVFGVGTGTFAEYALAPEGKLARKPADLPFDAAASVAISGMTALQALRDKARVQPGQRVLIIGASGGVGSFAVQIAKAFGAEVTGVASGTKVDLVRSLGADHVIDYTTSDIDEGGIRYDVILDIGGNRPLRQLRRALTADGTLVIVGGENGGRLVGGTDRQLRAMVRSLVSRQTLTSFIATETAEDVEALAELISGGAVTPAVAHTYPLAQASEALRDLESGRVRGKAVIVP